MSQLIEQYTVAVRVIGMHAEGKSIRKALREVGTMSRVTFERLCAENEDLRRMRVEAAHAFREQYHDLLLNIDDDPIEGRSDAKMAAVISANIKHVLAVEDRERFGDKVKIEHNITASEAIVKALDAARQRAGHGHIIDAVAVEAVGEAAAPKPDTSPVLPPPSTTAPLSAVDDPFARLAAF